MPNRAAIAGVATAVPEHTVTAEQLREYLPAAFHLDARRTTAIHAVIEHARVDQRSFVSPPEHIIRPRPLHQISCEYRTHSIALGRQAAEAVLLQTGMTPQQIDLLITVSCTGLMIPSLDAHLVNLMGFRSDVKRLPITELGCAAGAAALGRASEYLQAFPDHKVLLIAVELPSLTFQPDDTSQANLISCCLFGDGAAAVILTGAQHPGVQIVDSRSHLVGGSTDAMGFDLRGTGLRVILSKDVPQVVKREIGPVVDALLTRNGLSRSDLSFFALHPGGQKLLGFVEEELGLTEDQAWASWRVLQNYGNLSGATVLFVLKEMLEAPSQPSGSYGLLAAFGPGFSLETSLLQWN